MRVMDGCHGEESHELLNAAVCVCVKERLWCSVPKLRMFLGHCRCIPGAKSVLMGKNLIVMPYKIPSLCLKFMYCVLAHLVCEQFFFLIHGSICCFLAEGKNILNPFYIPSVILALFVLL